MRASAAAEQPHDVGAVLVAALARRRVGETVVLPRPVLLHGLAFHSASVLREFKTKTHALHVAFHPGNVQFICKFEDVTREHALMAALRQMNRRWQQRGIAVLGLAAEAVTYRILPLGTQVGLVELVFNSKTLCELGQGMAFSERQFRVARALGNEPRRLDRLAATTAAFLTAGYVLGIRDGHDDNIMLNYGDGALFRIDLGFSFGAAPEIDAPPTFVPNAVRVALGEQRWEEVVKACGRAAQALAGEGEDRGRLPLGMDLLCSVPELQPMLPKVLAYTTTLSLQDFGHQVRRADEWSFARAMKNTLREAVKYVLAEDDEGEATAAAARASAICERHPTAGGLGGLQPLDARFHAVALGGCRPPQLAARHCVAPASGASPAVTARPALPLRPAPLVPPAGRPLVPGIGLECGTRVPAAALGPLSGISSATAPRAPLNCGSGVRAAPLQLGREGLGTRGYSVAAVGTGAAIAACIGSPVAVGYPLRHASGAHVVAAVQPQVASAFEPALHRSPGQSAVAEQRGYVA